MRAMILAAGRGERMRPLTDTTPKPLLMAGGKALIVWHIERLAAAGFKELVINTAWLGESIEQVLGEGHQWGVSIAWSREGEARETAGGIAFARTLLGEEPFLLVNGDVYCDYPFERAKTMARAMVATNALAHLVMVKNPPQHARGDFILKHGRLIDPENNAGSNVATDANADVSTDSFAERLTYSGIAVIHPALVAEITPGSKAPLAPLLRAGMATGRIAGEAYFGTWEDIGTPQRLATLDARLRAAG
jgi:N-acetyl-alpha-D-muramate 1-phosphate uridylyltransferase